jgi:hypothetical protein
MVIDGNTTVGSDLAIVEFQRGRIRLPVHFVKQAGLIKNTPVDCWLLVVTPGRYRLLTQAEKEATEDLSEIHDRVKEVTASADVLDWTENNPQDAIPARLIACVATPRGPGWRIQIPKVLIKLAGEKENPSHVFMMTVAGYVEIWFPETLRAATSVPISKALP